MDYYLGPLCKLRDWIPIEKLVWSQLSRNPYIFEYDWVAMRNRINIFKEELVAKQFHPKNMAKFVSWGFEEFEDLEF